MNPNKMLLAATLALASCHCLGVSATQSEKIESRLSKVGGLVVAAGTFTGKIVLADAQQFISHSNIVSVAAALTSASDCNVVAERALSSDPVDALKKHSANVIILIVNDKSKPSLLLAPDDRWGIVNVAKIVDDLPSNNAKAKFIPSRVRKQLIRGFSILCGGASSSFPGNPMNAMSPRDLDYANEALPIDKLDPIHNSMRKIGVKPRKILTYAKACVEGCAPPPTNAIQKAIWDKVHAIPSNPMKIKYQPKK